MEEVYKEMNNFTDEYYWTKYFTRERMERSQRHYAKEQGFRESQIETVKNMLKDNIAIEKIQKYTELNIEEIKEIKKEMG